MEFAGEFETHVTIHLDEPHRVDDLGVLGSRLGLKLVHILLDRGATPSQPMLTRHGTGSLREQMQSAAEICAALNREGFAVTRVKIEAAPDNEDIPQDASAARTHPSDRYFEHHIKLLLTQDTDLHRLSELAEQHAAHLSRNALRVRADQLEERFVTQRCWVVGKSEAHHRLNLLLEALQHLGHPPAEVEEEFVVYDSNLAVDAGWIRTEV